jgi:hypothetical protein
MASERSARIDAEIEALAKEKERYVADAAAMAKERQRKSAAAHRDRRELPLVYIHIQYTFIISDDSSDTFTKCVS